MTISNVCAAVGGLGFLPSLALGATAPWLIPAAGALVALAVLIYPK